MLLVGLTGGIGSGKSTVAARFAERGAVIVDADVLAREALERGAAGYLRVAERWPEVVDQDGEVDRATLASIVFEDEAARKALEAIVHPEVGRRLFATIEAHRDTADIVVFDAPLIVEGGFGDGLDALVVVTSPVEEQVARLIRDRGMAEADARARIAAQAPNEAKVARADFVIANDGSLEDLRTEAGRVWDELVARERDGSGQTATERDT
jgi:dephospho-CoA kinase